MLPHIMIALAIAFAYRYENNRKYSSYWKKKRVLAIMFQPMKEGEGDLGNYT